MARLNDVLLATNFLYNTQHHILTNSRTRKYIKIIALAWCDVAATDQVIMCTSTERSITMFMNWICVQPAMAPIRDKKDGDTTRVKLTPLLAFCQRGGYVYRLFIAKWRIVTLKIPFGCAVCVGQSYYYPKNNITQNVHATLKVTVFFQIQIFCKFKSTRKLNVIVG